jgi:hypothetical protein
MGTGTEPATAMEIIRTKIRIKRKTRTKRKIKRSSP